MTLLRGQPGLRLYVKDDGSLFAEIEIAAGIWLWYEVKYYGEDRPN